MTVIKETESSNRPHPSRRREWLRSSSSSSAGWAFPLALEGAPPLACAPPLPDLAFRFAILIDNAPPLDLGALVEMPRHDLGALGYVPNHHFHFGPRFREGQCHVSHGDAFSQARRHGPGSHHAHVLTAGP